LQENGVVVNNIVVRLKNYQKYYVLTLHEHCNKLIYAWKDSDPDIGLKGRLNIAPTNRVIRFLEYS
jgi:hypothetical protein